MSLAVIDAEVNMMARAQAAMEFLMTYGWALLVVVAAIATLAYFGVLSPDRFVPEKCTMSPGISCSSFRVDTNAAQLYLRNGLGQDLSIDSIKVGDNCQRTYSPAVQFLNGDAKNFNITGCTNGAIGSRFKEDIVIDYTDAESGIAKKIEGQITAKIAQ